MFFSHPRPERISIRALLAEGDLGRVPGAELTSISIRALLAEGDG